MKVLFLDPVHSILENRLLNMGAHCEYDYSSNRASILNKIPHFDGVVLRSRIKIDAAFIDTAKKLNIDTDAKFRFERGIDPKTTEYALMHCAIIICELTGGNITSDIIDIYPEKIEDHQVFLNFDKANALIGQKIEKETINNIYSYI